MRSARIGFVLAAVLIAAQTGIAADGTAGKLAPASADAGATPQVAADAPLAPMSLSAIFAAAQAAVEQPAAAPAVPGMVIGVPSVEVVVARIEDGKLVTACFSSEAAAREFLEPKNDKVAVEGGK